MYIIEILLAIFLVSNNSFCQDNKRNNFFYTGRTFIKKQLSDEFYAEGAAIGDINNDGHPDIVAGPYWYEGPKFKTKYSFYKPKMFDPRKYSNNFIAAIDDVNENGRNDILIVGFPGEAAYWYENPKKRNSNTYWKRHLIQSNVDNESPRFYDLTGDGKLELIFVKNGYLGYATQNPDDPKQPWSFNQISQHHDWGRFNHGLGIGDVDGDGYKDLVKPEGWWENPGSKNLNSTWNFNKVKFGTEGAQMYVYDVNSDGHNDVVTTLDSHGWGLAWFRQKPKEDSISFKRNVIMGDSLSDNPYGVRFSDPHALAMVDIDNDGTKDFISGKRYWAHGPHGGLEPNAPAVIYWFKLNRKKENANFIPFLIDDASGVGVEIATGDLTGNGYPDIVTSNKKGTFVFLNRAK